MEKGDFIEVEYTGVIKETGEVFDTTSAKIAKEKGVYNEKRKYGPVFVIVGNKMVVEGVEKQLLKMKVNEEKTFDVPPSEGFGNRNPSLIKVIPLSLFLKKNIRPYPGIYVDINGFACKVQSVTSGRVRVDFNHPLAGKHLRYTVRIIRKIDDTKEKIEKILQLYNLKGDIQLKEKAVKITIEGKENETIKKIVSGTIKKWIKSLETINIEFKEKSNTTERRKK